MQAMHARLQPLVSSSRASNRGRTMQIVEEAFPKIAAAFVGLSIAIKFKPVLCIQIYIGTRAR